MPNYPVVGARVPPLLKKAIEIEAKAKGLTVSDLLNRWFQEKLSA